MRNDVARDLSDSAYDFLRVVWPAIAPRVRGGRLVPVESVASEDLIHDFDTLAGIDAWQMADELGGMRGIASRIQWGPKNWRTFTVRFERPTGARTEYEKRIFALTHPEEGWLLPHLTVHAYVNEPRRSGELIQAAVVRTADFYRYAQENPCRSPRVNGEDGVRFHWWRWDALRSAGVPVHIVTGPGSVTGEAA